MFEESIPPKFIDVVLSGVIAYDFVNDTLELRMILFGIDEVSTETPIPAGRCKALRRNRNKAAETPTRITP